MKKIITMAVLALFMASCSSNDSQPVNNEDTIFLKKIISTDEEGATVTYDYNYDGNKIISMVGSNGYEITYNYTGDYITYKKITSTEQISESFLEYNDEGKIIKTINNFTDLTNSMFNNNGEIIYTYNIDGSVTVNGTTEYTEIEQIDESEYTITYIDNTIIYDIGSNIIYTYNYDGKNNPTKNVIGFDTGLIGDSQNLLSYTFESSSELRVLRDNTYQYNNMNFPVSATIKEGNFGNNSMKTYNYQYFYE